MIYLASPYSDPDPAVRQARFEAACQTAAALMRQGHLVFSPIAHSHPLTRFGLPTDWAYWQRYDRTVLGWCTALWILTLPGWDRSVGVQAELRIAAERGLPVRYVDPADLATENTPAAVAGVGKEGGA